MVNEIGAQHHQRVATIRGLLDGLFALASKKASKPFSETRHSLPHLKPRKWRFRSHCVTVRSLIYRRLAISTGVSSFSLFILGRLGEKLALSDRLRRDDGIFCLMRG